MSTFHYGIPRQLVYSLHIIAGSWLALVGYNLTQGVKLEDYDKKVLLFAGCIAIAYQSWLWYAFPNDNYAYNVPAWLLHLAHILVGIMFVYVSQAEANGPLTGSVLLVTGSSAVLYMLHLWVLGPCSASHA